MILMLITTVWLGSLGFADDYIKIFKRDKEGLHGKFKIIGQGRFRFNCRNDLVFKSGRSDP